MLTHLPTRDDCQQLLQVLFMTEDREGHGSKWVAHSSPAEIDATFSLTGTDWDFNTAEVRGRLLVYHQILMGSLREDARWPTNLSKVSQVMQGKNEILREHLPRLLEAYRTYTAFDPEAREHQSTVNMGPVKQAAPDICWKLQILAPKSQTLIAFEWQDLDRGFKRLLNWIRLPQGFKNLLPTFEKALHEDLGEYWLAHLQITELQYALCVCGQLGDIPGGHMKPATGVVSTWLPSVC